MIILIRASIIYGDLYFVLEFMEFVILKYTVCILNYMSI